MQGAYMLTFLIGRALAYVSSKYHIEKKSFFLLAQSKIG
jgi:hypothetical protein